MASFPQGKKRKIKYDSQFRDCVQYILSLSDKLDNNDMPWRAYEQSPRSNVLVDMLWTTILNAKEFRRDRLDDVISRAKQHFSELAEDDLRDACKELCGAFSTKEFFVELCQMPRKKWLVENSDVGQHFIDKCQSERTWQHPTPGMVVHRDVGFDNTPFEHLRIVDAFWTLLLEPINGLLEYVGASSEESIRFIANFKSAHKIIAHQNKIIVSGTSRAAWKVKNEAMDVPRDVGVIEWVVKTLTKQADAIITQEWKEEGPVLDVGSLGDDFFINPPTTTPRLPLGDPRSVYIAAYLDTTSWLDRSNLLYILCADQEIISQVFIKHVQPILENHTSELIGDMDQALRTADTIESINDIVKDTKRKVEATYVSYDRSWVVVGKTLQRLDEMHKQFISDHHHRHPFGSTVTSVVQRCEEALRDYPLTVPSDGVNLNTLDDELKSRLQNRAVKCADAAMSLDQTTYSNAADFLDWFKCIDAATDLRNSIRENHPISSHHFPQTTLVVTQQFADKQKKADDAATTQLNVAQLSKTSKETISDYETWLTSRDKYTSGNDLVNVKMRIDLFFLSLKREFGRVRRGKDVEQIEKYVCDKEKKLSVIVRKKIKESRDTRILGLKSVNYILLKKKSPPLNLDIYLRGPEEWQKDILCNANCTVHTFAKRWFEDVIEAMVADKHKLVYIPNIAFLRTSSLSKSDLDAIQAVLRWVANEGDLSMDVVANESSGTGKRLVDEFTNIKKTRDEDASIEGMKLTCDSILDEYETIVKSVEKRLAHAVDPATVIAMHRDLTTKVNHLQSLEIELLQRGGDTKPQKDRICDLYLQVATLDLPNRINALERKSRESGYDNYIAGLRQSMTLDDDGVSIRDIVQVGLARPWDGEWDSTLHDTYRNKLERLALDVQSTVAQWDQPLKDIQNIITQNIKDVVPVNKDYASKIVSHIVRASQKIVPILEHHKTVLVNANMTSSTPFAEATKLFQLFEVLYRVVDHAKHSWGQSAFDDNVIDVLGPYLPRNTLKIEDAIDKWVLAINDAFTTNQAKIEHESMMSVAKQIEGQCLHDIDLLHDLYFKNIPEVASSSVRDVEQFIADYNVQSTQLKRNIATATLRFSDAKATKELDAVEKNINSYLSKCMVVHQKQTDDLFKKIEKKERDLDDSMRAKAKQDVIDEISRIFNKWGAAPMNNPSEDITSWLSSTTFTKLSPTDQLHIARAAINSSSISVGRIDYLNAIIEERTRWTDEDDKLFADFLKTIKDIDVASSAVTLRGIVQTADLKITQTGRGASAILIDIRDTGTVWLKQLITYHKKTAECETLLTTTAADTYGNLPDGIRWFTLDGLKMYAHSLSDKLEVIKKTHLSMKETKMAVIHRPTNDNHPLMKALKDAASNANSTLDKLTQKMAAIMLNNNYITINTFMRTLSSTEKMAVDNLRLPSSSSSSSSSSSGTTTAIDPYIRTHGAGFNLPDAVMHQLPDVLVDMYVARMRLTSDVTTTTTIHLDYPATYVNLQDGTDRSVDMKWHVHGRGGRKIILWSSNYVYTREVRFLPVVLYPNLRWWSRIPTTPSRKKDGATFYVSYLEVKTMLSNLKGDNNNNSESRHITTRFLHDVAMCTTAWPVDNDESQTYSCPLDRTTVATVESLDGGGGGGGGLHRVDNIIIWAWRGLTVFPCALSNYGRCHSNDRRYDVCVAAAEWFSRLDCALSRTTNAEGYLGPDFVMQRGWLNLTDATLFKCAKNTPSGSNGGVNDLVFIIHNVKVDPRDVFGRPVNTLSDEEKARCLNAHTMWFIAHQTNLTSYLWERCGDDNASSFADHILRNYPHCWNVKREESYDTNNNNNKKEYVPISDFNIVLTQFDAAAALYACGIRTFYFYSSDSASSTLWKRTFDSLSAPPPLQHGEVVEDDEKDLMMAAVNHVNDQSRDELWCLMTTRRDHHETDDIPILMWVKGRLVGYCTALSMTSRGNSDDATMTTTTVTVNVGELRKSTKRYAKEANNPGIWSRYDHDSFRDLVSSSFVSIGEREVDDDDDHDQSSSSSSSSSSSEEEEEEEEEEEDESIGIGRNEIGITDSHFEDSASDYALTPVGDFYVLPSHFDGLPDPSYEMWTMTSRDHDEDGASVISLKSESSGELGHHLAPSEKSSVSPARTFETSCKVLEVGRSSSSTPRDNCVQDLIDLIETTLNL